MRHDHDAPAELVLTPVALWGGWRFFGVLLNPMMGRWRDESELRLSHRKCAPTAPIVALKTAALSHP